MTASDCVLLLPATSKAWKLIVFAPLARVIGQLNEAPCTLADTPLHATVETPDRESETLPVTVIADVETIAPFAGDVILNAGGVLSRLTVADADMAFPATSVAVPEIA